MPISAANLFRVLVLLVITGHAYLMYGVARETMEQSVAVAASFTLAMMIPLVWAVGLPELPEVIRWRRALGRWRHGKCPGCAYPIAEITSDACPECGTQLAEPTPYQVTFRTVRTFVVLIVLAWVLGSAAGELRWLSG